MTTHERVDSPLRTRAKSVASPRQAQSSERLRLRGLTGWEEEYVERHQSEPNTARLCNEILARCLVAPGEEPADARKTVRRLLVAERDRELVALRRMSLGPAVGAQIDCPACGQVSEANFSLDALPLDFEVPPSRLTIALPSVGKVELRLPTAGDQEDLVDAGVEGAAERRSWLVARCLERYADQRDGFDIDFARSLPVAARTAIESAIEEVLPRLDLEMTFECAHCQASISAPFDVASFFFRNDRAVPSALARRARARARVSLGGAGHSRPEPRPASGVPAPARRGCRRGPTRRPRRERAGVIAIGRGG